MIVFGIGLNTWASAVSAQQKVWLLHDTGSLHISGNCFEEFRLDGREAFEFIRFCLHMLAFHIWGNRSACFRFGGF